eukprot:SAG22_NODE_5122_length_1081_cov_2.292261_2_plen_25_part_01
MSGQQAIDRAHAVLGLQMSGGGGGP